MKTRSHNSRKGKIDYTLLITFKIQWDSWADWVVVDKKAFSAHYNSYIGEHNIYTLRIDIDIRNSLYFATQL